MSPIIEVRDLSKLYHLGQIGRASLLRSARHRWRRIRGLPVDDLHSASAHVDIEPERIGPAPNTFWALKDVSFDVREGEVLGIIGRNGAGKSTLLKILSRITEPTSGYARLRGRVASLLEVGTGFHEDLTGRENIYLNGTILGLKKHEVDARLDEIVDFSGVEKFIDTPVKRYSSGMRVRLAFAVAAHLDPEILIVDEVLAVGDADFQSKCLGKMKDVAEVGRTVIFVSHQLPLVTRLCTRALLMKQGRIKIDTTPLQSISEYLSQTAGPPGEVPSTSVDKSLVAVTDLQILNHDSARARHLEVGKPWSVTYLFDTSQSLPAVTFAIGLQTIQGHLARAYWTPPCDMKPGRYKVALTDTETALTPGVYDLTIGITSGVDRLFENLHATRLTWNLTDYPMHSNFGRAGTCINRMSWNVKPVS